MLIADHIEVSRSMQVSVARLQKTAHLGRNQTTRINQLPLMSALIRPTAWQLLRIVLRTNLQPISENRPKPIVHIGSWPRTIPIQIKAKRSGYSIWMLAIQIAAGMTIQAKLMIMYPRTIGSRNLISTKALKEYQATQRVKFIDSAIIYI